MTTAPVSSELRRNLRASTIDGAAYSGAVGSGETYLPAFLLAMGGGELHAGLIATVPMLAGAALQLVSPVGVRWVGSLKRWVLVCAAAQTMSFVPMVVAALIGGIPIGFAFIIAALYWGSAMATGPAWNTWIGKVVPPELRARYFARRSRVTQITMVAGLLLAGAILQAGRERGTALSAFAIIFCMAGVCRLISLLYLAVQREPPSSGTVLRTTTPSEMLARLRGGGPWVLVYMLALTLATQIAAPFFTPYMLGEIGFSYTEYMLLLGMSFAAKYAILPVWGRLAHRYGARRLLWIGGVGVVPLAGLWMVSTSFSYLLAMQLLGGCVWGAYELATFLLIFETIHEDERTSVLTIFNVFNAVAIVAGSLAGGLLLRAFGVNHFAYMVLFAISSVGRLAALVPLLYFAPLTIPRVSLVVRAIAIRPSAGSFDVPVVASMSVEEEDTAEEASASPETSRVNSERR